MRSVRSDLLLAFYGAVIFTILPSYFLSYPIPEFSAKLFALLLVSFLVFSTWSFGQFLTESISVSFESSVLNIVLQFILGIGCLGTLILIAGWIVPGILTVKLTLISLMLLGLSGRAIYLKKLSKINWNLWQFNSMDVLLLALAFAGAFIAFIACFSPITYYDSLVYHLALPALYNRMGSVTALPSNLYSYFPANMEMIYLFIMNQMTHPEYVINLLQWVISIGIGFGIAQWCSESAGKRAGILALVLWWTMPAVLLLSNGAYIDISLSAFVFLSVRTFFLSKENQWKRSMLFLSGLFGGFAFSTKYTGAICFILLGVYLFFLGLKNRRGMLPNILIFAGSFLLPSLFWLIKNWVSIGNPFFPFFYKWLGVNTGWSQESAAGYFVQLVDYGAKSNLFIELFQAPWHLSTSAMKYGGGFDVLGDFGWPLLLFSAPLAFFLDKQNRATQFTSIYCLSHFLLWLESKPVLRFLIALLPVTVFLSTIGLCQLFRHKLRLVKICTLLIAIPWFCSNFFLYFFIAQGLQPFTVALGFENREDYLLRRLPYYATFKFANENLKSNEKVLLIGDQRTYHLLVPFISSNLFASSPIAEASNSAQSFDDLKDYCVQNNITHVLINEGEIERLGGLGRFGFNSNGSHQIHVFLNENATILFQNHRVKLCRINI